MIFFQKRWNPKSKNCFQNNDSEKLFLKLETMQKPAVCPPEKLFFFGEKCLIRKHRDPKSKNRNIVRFETPDASRTTPPVSNGLGTLPGPLPCLSRKIFMVLLRKNMKFIEKNNSKLPRMTHLGRIWDIFGDFDENLGFSKTFGF